MKKQYLDWGRAPVVLFTDDGHPRAAFLKADPYAAWRPCNPLQVLAEAAPMTRSAWIKKFKHLAVEKLPRFKDWNNKDIYVDEDWWFDPNEDVGDDVEPLQKADTEAAQRKRYLARMDWDEDELEIIN